MATTEATLKPCAWCGKPSDGERYILPGGAVFAACSARHALAWQRAQSKPAFRPAERSSAATRK